MNTFKNHPYLSFNHYLLKSDVKKKKKKVMIKCMLHVNYVQYKMHKANANNLKHKFLCVPNAILLN